LRLSLPVPSDFLIGEEVKTTKTIALLYVGKGATSKWFKKPIRRYMPTPPTNGRDSRSLRMIVALMLVTDFPWPNAIIP